MVFSPGDHLVRFTVPAQTYTLDAHHKTSFMGQGREALPSVINKAPAVNRDVVRITRFMQVSIILYSLQGRSVIFFIAARAAVT